MARHFYATEFTEDQRSGAHQLVLYVFSSRAQRNEWVAENNDSVYHAMDPTHPEVLSSRNSYTAADARSLVKECAVAPISPAGVFYINTRHSFDGDLFELPEWIRSAFSFAPLETH